MQIHLSALGCRLNEAELELWAGEFRREGHHLVTHPADADVMVLNTCAVTQEAVRKSRKSIQQLQRHNPLAKMVVSGCFVSLEDSQSAAELGVDLVVKNSEKNELVRYAKDALELSAMPQSATAPDASTLFKRNRHRAFIKIQDGCRYRCTFCVVTLARGSEKSRTINEIVDEVNELASQGVLEIVLTGVHVGGYGSDLDTDLQALVIALLKDTDIPRIRFASVEPWDLPDNFLSLFSNTRLMPHMHLPLQSGSDTVLRRMARRCKTQDFRDLVRQLREGIPDFNVTTDIIVGFPGETDAEWQDTVDFVEETGFGHIHIFSYSIRSGTKAAGLPDQLSGTVKKARSRQLHEIADKLKYDYQQQFVGRTMPVLWERGRVKAQAPKPNEAQEQNNQQIDASDSELMVFSGYTPNYLRVNTTVINAARINEKSVLGIRPIDLSSTSSSTSSADVQADIPEQSLENRVLPTKLERPRQKRHGQETPGQSDKSPELSGIVEL